MDVDIVVIVSFSGGWEEQAEQQKVVEFGKWRKSELKAVLNGISIFRRPAWRQGKSPGDDLEAQIVGKAKRNGVRVDLDYKVRFRGRWLAGGLKGEKFEEMMVREGGWWHQLPH
jgi:hypothetical protein